MASWQWITDLLKIPRKEGQRGDDVLDGEFRASYYKQLIGRFRTLDTEVKNEAARTCAETIAKKDPLEVTWDDVYQLELVIVQLEPEIDLRRHLWSLRSEYENVAPKEYQEYLKSNPPDAKKDLLPEVRADAERVQNELNWYYTVLWVQEALRSSLLKRITRRTLLYLAIYLCAGLGLMGIGFVGGLLDVFGNRPASAMGADSHNNAMNPPVAAGSLTRNWVRQIQRPRARLIRT